VIWCFVAYVKAILVEIPVVVGSNLFSVLFLSSSLLVLEHP
jgi:hypothetical protein